jgi:hypothetical protein
MLLEVAAKTSDGKEIYKETKIYMPYPGRFCRGDQMGRGPYEKCGFFPDTTLPVNREVTATFRIPYPYKDVKKGDETERNILSKEIEINFELWYVPFGETTGPLSQWNVLWHKVTKKVTIE